MAPITTSGNVQRRFPFASMIQLSPAKNQEAHSAAKQCPSWRPDPLHDGADSQNVQQYTAEERRKTGDEKIAKRNRRRGVAQPTTGDQTEDHRAQRRDKAERQVSSIIRDERVYSREQVQKPLVERGACIAVLVPVRHEAGVVMLPIRWNSHSLIIEIRSRNRVQGPSQPITEENHSEGGPLPSWSYESE